MTTREQQKEHRRQEILSVALDLFVRKGYPATKISDIADVSQISMGLLFHYFKSKEELYMELVKIGLAGTKQPIEMGFSEPLEFFQGFATRLFGYIKEQSMITKMFVLMAQAAQNDSTPPEIRELAMQVNTIELSTAIIIKGQENGTIRSGDPLALSTAFWCSIQGLLEYLATTPEAPMPQAEWIVDILRKH